MRRAHARQGNLAGRHSFPGKGHAVHGDARNRPAGRRRPGDARIVAPGHAPRRRDDAALGRHGLAGHFHGIALHHHAHGVGLSHRHESLLARKRRHLVGGKLAPVHHDGRHHIARLQLPGHRGVIAPEHGGIPGKRRGDRARLRAHGHPRRVDERRVHGKAQPLDGHRHGEIPRKRPHLVLGRPGGKARLLGAVHRHRLHAPALGGGPRHPSRIALSHRAARLGRAGNGRARAHRHAPARSGRDRRAHRMEDLLEDHFHPVVGGKPLELHEARRRGRLVPGAVHRNRGHAPADGRRERHSGALAPLLRQGGRYRSGALSARLDGEHLRLEGHVELVDAALLQIVQGEAVRRARGQLLSGKRPRLARVPLAIGHGERGRRQRPALGRLPPEGHVRPGREGALLGAHHVGLPLARRGQGHERLLGDALELHGEGVARVHALEHVLARGQGRLVGQRSAVHGCPRHKRVLVRRPAHGEIVLIGHLGRGRQAPERAVGEGLDEEALALEGHRHPMGRLHRWALPAARGRLRLTEGHAVHGHGGRPPSRKGSPGDRGRLAVDYLRLSGRHRAVARGHHRRHGVGALLHCHVHPMGAVGLLEHEPTGPRVAELGRGAARAVHGHGRHLPAGRGLPRHRGIAAVLHQRRPGNGAARLIAHREREGVHAPSEADFHLMVRPHLAQGQPRRIRRRRPRHAVYSQGLHMPSLGGRIAHRRIIAVGDAPAARHRAALRGLARHRHGVEAPLAHHLEGHRPRHCRTLPAPRIGQSHAPPLAVHEDVGHPPALLGLPREGEPIAVGGRESLRRRRELLVVAGRHRGCAARTPAHRGGRRVGALREGSAHLVVALHGGKAHRECATSAAGHGEVVARNRLGCVLARFGQKPLQTAPRDHRTVHRERVEPPAGRIGRRYRHAGRLAPPVALRIGGDDAALRGLGGRGHRIHGVGVFQAVPIDDHPGRLPVAHGIHVKVVLRRIVAHRQQVVGIGLAGVQQRVHRLLGHVAGDHRVLPHAVPGSRDPRLARHHAPLVAAVVGAGRDPH